MSYSQVKMDDLPPSLIERQSLAQTDDTNDGRIHIAIHVDQTHQIFSEGDIVTGSATITADVDVYAPYIEVDFIGYATTCWENPLMGAGIFEGKHSFLTMSCPVGEMTMLKARAPFETKWEFTVPEQLLPTSCKHEADDETRRAHLLLPPSMDRSWSKANPETLKIVYGPRVRVNGLWKLEDSDPALLAESFASVRFASAYGGRNSFFPPFDVTSYDSCPTQTLETKPSRASKLTVSTTGLPSMTLDVAQIAELPEEERKRRATSVGLILTFETADARAKPPEPSSVSAKLGIATSFSTTPSGRPPPLKRTIRSQGFALDTTKWPQRDMHQLRWQVREEDGRFKHEAYLVYPIERCSLEQLVPTFDSCLVSRQYKVSLKLTMRHSGSEHVLRPEVPILVAHDPAVSEH